MKLTKFIIFILLSVSLLSLVSIYRVTLSGNVVMMNNVPFFQVQTVAAGSGAGIVVPPTVGPMPPGTVLKCQEPPVRDWWHVRGNLPRTSITNNWWFLSN